jgi:ribose 5-phosphate isomerase
MSTPIMDNASKASLDLEKQGSSEIEPQLEAIRTGAAPHALEKSQSTRSNHPLELVESHRTYSGFKWFLVCIAMYVVSISLSLSSHFLV